MRVFGTLLSSRAAHAICVVSLGMAAAGDAAALDQRAYDFQITWSIAPQLTLSSGRLTLEQDDAFYSVAMNAEANFVFPRINWRGVFAVQGDRRTPQETIGLLSGMRAPGALAATAAGVSPTPTQVTPASLRAPQRFERSSIRPEVREDVVVSWADPAEPPRTSTRRTPETAAILREEIEADSTIGVVDPITFALGILDTVADSDGRSCDLDARTWDGARLSELEVRTEESLVGSYAECRLIYRSIRGLRRDNPWRSREESVSRIARFEKRLGRWEPASIRISGRFVGFQSEFVTTFEPVGGLR